jgi:drug/metabolite transporter (DMT)-like permease
MSIQASTKSRTNLVAPIVAIVLGIVLVLVAQFTLDHLADTSDAWHNIQHGTFLLGGVLIGIGGTLLWASGQRA